MQFYQLTWANSDDSNEINKREYFHSKVDAIRRYKEIEKDKDGDTILIDMENAIQKFTFKTKKDLLIVRCVASHNDPFVEMTENIISLRMQNDELVAALQRFVNYATSLNAANDTYESSMVLQGKSALNNSLP